MVALMTPYTESVVPVAIRVPRTDCQKREVSFLSNFLCCIVTDLMIITSSLLVSLFF